MKERTWSGVPMGPEVSEWKVCCHLCHHYKFDCICGGNFK